ncbi:YdeI/OmpD-associated family protein [Rhodobacteraceae bacterium M385]|nr:YdeI/OmpD-associated family protein [Rhodobacteraceae bacterium M385]
MADLKRESETHQSFATAAELESWLAAHYATETALWVRIYKKGSGVASVTWDDCVVACLIWGWIDGQKRSLDNESYLQRISPRRARSGWSQRNVKHVERLMAEGRMRPEGLAQVQAAKDSGQWEKAYAGSADMEFSADFLAALAAQPVAEERFEKLTRSRKFAIYAALTSARKEETRQRRMAKIIAELAAP